MSDGKNIETQGNSLLVVSIVLLAIANTASISRLAIRGTKKQLGLDDFVLALATMILDLQTAFVFCSIQYGFGKHGADLTHTELHTALMYFYLIQVIYKLLGGLTKASFVLLYVRIFARPRFQWFSKWVVMPVIITSTVAFTMATIFQCKPIPMTWNKTLSGHCINNTAFWYAHAAIHTSLDLVILSMPIPMVWKLHMPRQKRIGLVGLFILGFFGCIASVIRMTALDSSSKTSDPTWGSYNALMWTVIEANISLTCACLPPLRGPAMHAFRRARGQQGTSIDEHQYDLRSLSRSRRRQRSIMGEADVGDWQTDVDKDSYAIGIKEASERSGSEVSIVPRMIPGITKTTQWEIVGSDNSPHGDEMQEPERIHSRA